MTLYTIWGENLQGKERGNNRNEQTIKQTNKRKMHEQYSITKHITGLKNQPKNGCQSNNGRIITRISYAEDILYRTSDLLCVSITNVYYIAYILQLLVQDRNITPRILLMRPKELVKQRCEDLRIW